MDDKLKQKFLPDEYIFEQGEKGDKAYLLLDGRIAIEVNGKKVSEISAASGIVLESTPKKEFNENFIKAKSLLELYK